MAPSSALAVLSARRTSPPLEGRSGQRDSLYAYDPTMRRAQALEILARHREELRSLGVRSLSVFGSVARDEAATGSDVDLLIEFDRPTGLFHLYEVRARLEVLLGCAVDLVMSGGLRPELRDRILAEAVRAA